MFEESLFESSGRLTRRHPWTAMVSFTAQALFIAVLLLIPLLYTQALPELNRLRILEVPPPPPPAPRQPAAIRSSGQPSNEDRGVIRVPSEIPRSIAILHDEEARPPAGDGVPGAVPGGSNGADGVANGVIADIIRNVTPAVPKSVQQKVRVSSGVAQGSLIHEVRPEYPALARQARIQGTVVLQAVIGKDGKVQGLHVLSGHPLLVQAALNAVSQWRYRPYYLNEEPVEVDTQINVNFTLNNP